VLIFGGFGGNATANSGNAASGRGGRVILRATQSAPWAATVYTNGTATSTSGSATQGIQGAIEFQGSCWFMTLDAAPDSPQAGSVAVYFLTADGGTKLYTKDFGGTVRSVTLA
jgi:hypothetical protein